MLLKIHVFTKCAVLEERKEQLIRRGYRIENERPASVNGLCSLRRSKVIRFLIPLSGSPMLQATRCEPSDSPFVPTPGTKPKKGKHDTMSSSTLVDKREMLTIFPLRLLVSSTVRASSSLADTIVWPGSSSTGQKISIKFCGISLRPSNSFPPLGPLKSVLDCASPAHACIPRISFTNRSKATNCLEIRGPLGNGIGHGLHRILGSIRESVKSPDLRGFLKNAVLGFEHGRQSGVSKNGPNLGVRYGNDASGKTMATPRCEFRLSPTLGNPHTPRVPTFPQR